MEDTVALVNALPVSARPQPPLTVSPSDTSLTAANVMKEETTPEAKKPAKKRKSWGQELPIPKTNLPPRKRAKTEDEKEQRRIERVLRNRAAAQTSRERKRLEMEKLEKEKTQIEQQNQFLLQRLAQMEAENTRLCQKVAQLSAEVRGSRSNSSHASPSMSTSPTLAPTLFKQEDELLLERMPFPTPSITELSSTLEPSILAESSDLTQHPAAVLCDLQCQSQDLKEMVVLYPSLTPNPILALTLRAMLQLLFLTVTSAAYSTVVRPLSLILISLKSGLPLTFSTQEIRQHLPLILWLISTPNLSPSEASSGRSTVFRMRLLTRLLTCNPALARPLRDVTGNALRLVASEPLSKDSRSAIGSVEGRRNLMSLLTLAWATRCLERSNNRRRRIWVSSSDFHSVTFNSAQRDWRSGYTNAHLEARSLGSSSSGETLTSLLMGKQI